MIKLLKQIRYGQGSVGGWANMLLGSHFSYLSTTKIGVLDVEKSTNSTKQHYQTKSVKINVF